MFCAIYNALVRSNCEAVTDYYVATSRLMALAGYGKTGLFAAARRDCKLCLQNCKRTAAVLNAHKAAHRCCWNGAGKRSAPVLANA